MQKLFYFENYKKNCQISRTTSVEGEGMKMNLQYVD